MGCLLKYYFKNIILCKIFSRQTKSVTSLAHSRGLTEKELISKNNANTKIDERIINQLERISLVEFGNEAGIHRLKAAICFAQKLREIKIDSSVEPMYSVLENEILELREDKISEGNYRNRILKNAKILEDEYFVAPPSNIRKKN